MEKKHDLFFSILAELETKEVLQDIILIGSWCLLVYKEYFGNPIEISMQRTLDLDFLVPNHLHMHKNVDVSLILKELSFDRKLSLMNGFEKYVHPDLEVEFLTPEKGRGENKPYPIDKFHITAQGLRYLDILESHTIEVSLNGISPNVPEPAAYVLHKFIVSDKRNKKFKKEKDIATAIQLVEYLLGKDYEKMKMQKIYLGMPEKWKKDLLRIVKDCSGKVYAFPTQLMKKMSNMPDRRDYVNAPDCKDKYFQGQSRQRYISSIFWFAHAVVNQV